MVVKVGINGFGMSTIQSLLTPILPLHQFAWGSLRHDSVSPHDTEVLSTSATRSAPPSLSVQRICADYFQAESVELS
jgi:hypothetical protein